MEGRAKRLLILGLGGIAFAPRPALLDPGEPCDICQYTSFRPRVCSCVTLASQVHRRQKQLSDFVSTKSKKSTAKRGSLCDPRNSHKTVTCHGLRVMEPVCHQASLRGRFTSWMRASRQGQPCSCLFFKTHQIGLFLCFSVQSRRRPEKWTRTRKAGSRGSATPTQFLDHVLCLRNTITSRRWRASSPSRSSPTPASLVKSRSRHTS